MTLVEIINDLETLKQYFMEKSDGCFPLSLDEAQKVITSLIDSQGIKPITTISTETYDVGDGFLVDIVSNDRINHPMWEGWIYHESVGVKQFIEGSMKETTTHDEAVRLFTEFVDEDIDLYKEEYMQD